MPNVKCAPAFELMTENNSITFKLKVNLSRVFKMMLASRSFKRLGFHQHSNSHHFQRWVDSDTAQCNIQFPITLDSLRQSVVLSSAANKLVLKQITGPC